MRSPKFWAVFPAVVIVFPVAAFFVLNALSPFPESRLRPPGAAMVVDRNGVPLRFYLAADQAWRFPVTLEQVSPVFRATLTASEDRFFRYHPGVNPFSIIRAFFSNLAAGRVVCGASTITMQLARLAEPKPRTFGAKLQEMFRAAQLELRYDKDQLLERYLNLTPYGGNIVGVGAAASFYFGKSPDRLSLGEAALLTALPRAPAAYDPVAAPEAARKARNQVLAQLAERGAITEAEAAEAAASPLPRSRTKPPFIAPQFCDLVRSRRPEARLLSTTLDAGLYAAALETVRGRMDALRSRGVRNAAAVILDARSRDVLAMVGSDDFFDEANNGQINGAVIRRSPGSTLKPFLYALAFDQGLIVPESLLLDIPTDFAGYAPKNFDGLYRGRVSAALALTHSLNVPAVRLLDAVGVRPFHDLLVRGGVSALDKPAEHYGLSLILGGGEVTLLSLANLYADLSQGGRHAPPRLLADDPGGRGLFLLSPEACQLTSEILTEVERPDLPTSWDRALNAPTIAWKTGTSFGHRDAWAVGFSADYVIGVWTGNMDGSPVKGISGAVHAGPLLFDLFRAVTRTGSRLESPSTLDVGEIEVCAVSRQLPGPACDQTMRINYIPGHSRFIPCPMHKRILIDKETGLRLAGECLERRPAESKTVTEYPPELVAWWRASGIAFDAPPELSPECAGAALGQAPKITSPSAVTPYRLRSGVPAQYQRIALAADASAQARTLYWFLDGELTAKGAPGEKLFVTPEPGSRRLVVVDDLGRLDAVTFTVEGPGGTP